MKSVLAKLAKIAFDTAKQTFVQVVSICFGALVQTFPFFRLIFFGSGANEKLQ